MDASARLVFYNRAEREKFVTEQKADRCVCANRFGPRGAEKDSYVRVPLSELSVFRPSERVLIFVIPSKLNGYPAVTPGITLVSLGPPAVIEEATNGEEENGRT